MEFPTQYSESVQKGSFEAFTKPSMTEPDNAMSIPEIIARFTRGQGLCVNQNPVQSGDAFGEGDPNNMEDWLQDLPAAAAAAGRLQDLPAADLAPAPASDPAPSPTPAPAQE